MLLSNSCICALHDRTGRLEIIKISGKTGVELHDRTGRLENKAKDRAKYNLLHDRTGRLENMLQVAW